MLLFFYKNKIIQGYITLPCIFYIMSLTKNNKDIWCKTLRERDVINTTMSEGASSICQYSQWFNYI